MTPEQEERLIGRFKERYEQFPEGNLVRCLPPLPDFIIESSKGIIGIELTEMFHSQKAKQQSSFKNDVTDLTLKELSKILSFGFSLDVFPHPEMPIAKRELPALAKQLAHQCFREFRDLKDMQTRSLEHIELDLQSPEYIMIKQEILSKGYRNLPRGIERIVITRHDKYGSWNAQTEAAIVPNITADNIGVVISKKEKRRNDYGELNECWLIIQEGNYLTGSFDEIILKAPVSSLFDKVFLYRLQKQEIVILK